MNRKAKESVDRGELVPDEIVIDMILKRVVEPDCNVRVIFDGFPRTSDKAEALADALAAQSRVLHSVVALGAPRDVLLTRIAGRVTCTMCQAPYNIFYTPPRLEAFCDLCGGDLETRSDDNMQTARHRLDVYQRETFPLIEYFRGAGLLREVDAVGPVETVIERVTQGLGVPATAGGGTRSDGAGA